MNILYGSQLYGSFVWGAGKKKGTGGGTGGGGTGGGTTSDVVYIPNSVQVVFYNKTARKQLFFPTAPKAIPLHSFNSS